MRNWDSAVGRSFGRILAVVKWGIGVVVGIGIESLKEDRRQLSDEIMFSKLHWRTILQKPTDFHSIFIWLNSYQFVITGLLCEIMFQDYSYMLINEQSIYCMPPENSIL